MLLKTPKFGLWDQRAIREKLNRYENATVRANALHVLLQESLPSGYGVRKPAELQITPESSVPSSLRLLVVVAKQRRPVATICVREGEKRLVIHALGANKDIAESISSKIKETTGSVFFGPKVVVGETLPKPVMIKEEAKDFSRTGVRSRITRWFARHT